MPLSELIYRLAKEKFDSSQEKNSNCSTDKPQGGENDFGELVWENGQIQSSRGRKCQNSNQNSKIRDKDLGNGNNLRMGRFGVEPMDSGVDEVPSGFHQDDDMAPWLNYQVDDFLQQDYCSEFLSELSGVTANEHSQSSNNNNNQSIRGSNTVSVHNGLSLDQGQPPKVSSVGDRTRSGQLYPLSSQQSQSSFPYLRSRVLPSNHEPINGPLDHDSLRVSCSGGSFSNTKQPPLAQSSSSGLMNFAHFSRPVAAVKANLQNIGMRGGSGIPNIERTGSNKDKSSANDTFCKPFEPKPAEEPVLLRKLETLDRGDESKTDKYCVQVAESATKGFVEGEKNSEPIVTSSSVCSGNSVERVSDEPIRNMKRKNREADSSEGPSEENEEEPVGTKKGAHARGGTGCKRTRAAEVHNLSERRRRDRINEKMRALQELIPNCNKVDKASMLDEAIEYLKTLQLQVQIMSMGPGLYMPSMMMTPMHAAHMAQFSPMGVGMGMGFGMGMPDMIGGSPGCSMVQMPPMHGAHFPGPPMPGPSAMRGMGGSNFPMFGISSQGHPMQYPCPPMMPMSGPSVPRPMGINGVGIVAGSVDNLDSGPGSSSKDSIQNVKSNPVQNDGANSSMNQMSTQCQATKECGENPALVQTSEAIDNGALKPANGE